MIKADRRRTREATEQELAEKEVDRFRRALGPFVVAAEMTRMAMIFTNGTEAGNPIIFANQSFLALTGFAAEEVVGKSFNFLMSRMADPESVARIEAQFAAQSSETVEVQCRRRGEQAFLVAVRINPVHDKDGNVVQHCVSFIDLSVNIERRRRERDALHALYQCTPDFIATTVGVEHRFASANDAFQRIFDDRGMLGLPVAEAIPELAAQGFIAALGEVYETGISFAGRGMAVELQRGPPPGHETRFIDFICQAIRDPNGETTGIFCEGHDVTEQKLAAGQVRRLQAEVIHLARVSAMGTLAATLAHELAQPLTAISNYSAICHRVIDDDAGRAALAEGLAGIRQNATRANEIIRRLKNMTKRKGPEYEQFDLKDAVVETLDLVRLGPCVAVFINDRSRGLMLSADRVQIQQVLVNLVRNGCEAASGRGGARVTISTSVSEDRVIVSVEDNGPGVSPEARASLFDWSDSTKPDGTGIGLSICRTIIDAHGGDIWLEKSDSEGACFRFSLPLGAVHEAPAH